VEYIAPGRVLRAEIEPELKHVAGILENG